MSLLAQRRAFLMAYRKSGTLEDAAAAVGLEPSIHKEWMKDWLYRSAYAEVEKEIRQEKAGKLPPPAPPKRPPGRPRKAIAGPPPPKRPRGRPPKIQTEAPTIADGSPDEPVETPVAPPGAPQDRSNPVSAPEPSPPVQEHVYPGDKGYVKLFVPEGEVPAAPAEPERPKRQAQEPSPDPALDITVASDAEQRALIDEYGELDRRMQLRATDTARYESLKRAIKAWFANVPPDADGTVEGDVYLLHLSACERERKIRSVQDLVEVIGLEKVLDLAIVPIGQLENLIGQSRVAGLTVETRTGSRRIKAIPKRPAGIAVTP
jgi:hypothetical protein